jgi:N utilization substance protein A
MKGMRVQSIIRELRGEKIDIIEYNEDPLVFAANALSPAKINHVSILELDQKHLEVIVDDTQLSLAIGKKGQNVRLAAKLLGWHVDIKSEEEKRQEIESQMAAMALRGASISELHGVGEKTLQRLRERGIETVEQLAQMTPDDLTQIPGIGEKTVEKIRRVVTDYFEQDREPSTALAAPAEAEAVKAEEPLGEHPATLDEAVEEEPNAEGPAAEASVEAAGAEPAAERAESSEEEASPQGEGGKEE